MLRRFMTRGNKTRTPRSSKRRYTTEEKKKIQDMVDTVSRKYQQREYHIEAWEWPIEILYTTNRKSYLQKRHLQIKEEHCYEYDSRGEK